MDCLVEHYSDSKSADELQDEISLQVNPGEFSIIRHKRRILQVSDSDDDELDNDKKCNNPSPIKDKITSPKKNHYISEFEESLPKHVSRRIARLSSSDDSDNVSSSDRSPIEFPPSEVPKKNKGQQNRMKTKINQKRDRFSSLLSSRKKNAAEIGNVKDNVTKISDQDENSADELPIIADMREKIKNRVSDLNNYDSLEKSEEEEFSINNIKIKHKAKSNHKRKSTKLISPEPLKPVRISAKQAMENMQKIKSESNRMLREKEVTLPYHRPKALSLKDIMSRRKPALTMDGKTLPLKMNDQQLKQYSNLLEQRQKEIMELCKSESEEEEESVENQKYQIERDENSLCCEKISDLTYDNLMSKETVITDLNQVDDLIKIDLNNTEDKNVLGRPEDTDIVEHKECKNIDSEYCSSSKKYDSGNLAVGNNTSDSEVDCQINENSNSVNIKDKFDTLDIFKNHCDEDEVKQDHLHESLFTIGANATQNSNNNKSVNENNDLELAFSDDDVNIEDVDSIIESYKIDHSKTAVDISSNLIQPKLTGTPGMIIDLDDDNPCEPKMTGVELLKERFTYFAKIKTAEESEREMEKRTKPGTQHLKLRHELEEKIAEQRSLEWAKRLEEDKQKQSELKDIMGDNSDSEDDLEKIEAKLAEDDEFRHIESDQEETGEDLIENDIDMSDKKKKHNPLIENEAEESDIDGNDQNDNRVADVENNEYMNDEEDNENDISEDGYTSSDDSENSSDEEQEDESKVKRGRILKAFEDSDDECAAKEMESLTNIDEINPENNIVDKLHSTQLHQCISDDIFTSQETIKKNNISHVPCTLENSMSLTQSIGDRFDIDKVLNEDGKQIDSEKKNYSDIEKLSVICETQPYDEAKFDDIVGMCSGSFSQNLVSTQPINPLTLESTDSQAIGEDILAMCTGNFYDNQFVNNENPKEENGSIKEKSTEVQIIENKQEHTLLQSILNELDDPELDKAKPNKYFCGDKVLADSNKHKENYVMKKKFVIDSDDEEAETTDTVQKKKKPRRKRLEKRALQISDDEDEYEEVEEMDDDLSDIDDNVGEEHRIVEYDSEENEVVVKPHKGKRRTMEFLEHEAELTSEDEWAGSGDEDEAGLDRMEREAGDDDSFHQGRLQAELGQIHMREVLDQDKREVRMIQELLFEDGDLGDGHRQRKFRWKNVDGEEERGTIPEELANTQEEDFESEEQWRKQRHERETFLRQLMKQEEVKEGNVSISRTTIIKANLTSKTMSNLLLELNGTNVEKTEMVTTAVEMKQLPKDMPSTVEKPFQILQHQQYRRSLLLRGGGALSRLAALAGAGTGALAAGSTDPAASAPAAATNARNFVFATVSPGEQRHKVVKRKVESNPGTPNLIKKLKTEEKTSTRRSLLDHMKI